MLFPDSLCTILWENSISFSSIIFKLGHVTCDALPVKGTVFLFSTNMRFEQRLIRESDMSHFWAEALSAKTWLCPLISRCHEPSNVLDGNSPSTWDLGERRCSEDYSNYLWWEHNVSKQNSAGRVTETHLLWQHNITYPDYSASFIVSTVLSRDYKIIPAGQSP